MILTSHGWVEQNSPWLRKTFLTPVVNMVKERQEGSGSSQPTTVRRAAEMESWLDNIHFISYVDRWLTSTVGKWKWGSFEEGINHHSSIFWWWSNYMLEQLCYGALAIVTRTQCLPPDVWGPTQMLNINIIQCNWTSVTEYKHRGTGLWRAHLQHSSSNGLGVTTRKSDFMDVYKTSNSTCTLYLSSLGSIHARSAWVKYNWLTFNVLY